MKTAALLSKHGTNYFKIGLSGVDNQLRIKLRVMRGFRKIGLSYYFLPYTDDAIDFLIDNKFEFNGAFLSLQKKEYEKQNPIASIPKYEKLGYNLYKYQVEGVNFIEYHKGRAIIADVMGLGKTIQALGWVQYRKDIKKVLIVCPSSLKINWQEEFEKWVTRPFKIQLLEGTTPYQVTGDVAIINYDILNAWIIELKLTHFDVCIADELHYVKSTTAQRTKAFIEITKGIQNLIGLTGTPIENDPMEIFYLVNLVNKNIFPNYVKFIERYCDAKQIDQRVKSKPIPKSLELEMYSVASEIKEIKQKGILRKIDKEKLESLLVKDGELFEKWDSLKHPIKKIWKRNGFTNQMELHRILKKHVMIRRTKEEVDLQLPPKTYANVDLKIDNWQVYKQAEDNFIQYIKESFDAKAEKQLDANLHPEELDLDEKLDAISRAPALAMIQALKMLAAEGKMKQVIEWVKDFLDTDEKLIIFAINKVIVQTLMDAFPFAVKIDGSTTKAKRNEAVKSFQNDEKCRLFIGNMKAAGIGLTLTAASKVAIVQFPWNPGELVQAEDRAHRITQKEKVTIYKFVAKDTIEERIVQLLKNKQIEIDKIIDGTNVNMNTDLVKLLINSYK